MVDAIKCPHGPKDQVGAEEHEEQDVLPHGFSSKFRERLPYVFGYIPGVVSAQVYVHHFGIVAKG